VADRRVGRVVERGGLENRYRVTPYRGFESLTLRHHSEEGRTPGEVAERLKALPC
jgi:hypothetical protein